ncbi:MAG: type II secretion system protein N [Cellvibrionaceae bacterium]|nr:type II secretion system protein N [Cellvibrionaceae bacterium]
MAKLLFFIGLAVYFLVTVVARTPAEWGAWVALKSVPGLSLTGVSGTLWSGRAGSAQVAVNGHTLDLGALQWRLHGWSLLLFKACLDVRSPSLQGDVCQSAGGTLSVRKLMVDQVPAKIFYNHPDIQVGGIGSAAVERADLTLDGRVKDLQGNLTWQRLAVNAGTGWFTLGTFAADARANGQGGIALNITDLEGDFKVELQGDYTVGGQPTLNGLITPKDTAPQPLKDALGALHRSARRRLIQSDLACGRLIRCDCCGAG